MTAPADLIQTVGRRKEAVVRVRLVPGTGQYKLNGRTLEEYFPNKVHQQAINEPFVTLEKAEQSTVYNHSGFPGGLKRTSYADVLATRPERIIEKAVKGMLPHNTLGRQMLSKL